MLDQPRELSRSPFPATSPTYPSAGSDEPHFLFTAVRKRWLPLLICLIVSCLVAVGWTLRFKKQTVEVHGSLLYSDLPLPPGPRVYQPPNMATYTALFASQPLLVRLIEKHGLEIAPILLERQVKLSPANSRSSTIDVTFNWGDEQAAVPLLDDMIQLFIEDVVRRRSETIETHITHTERMLLASRAKVDEATEKLRAYQRRAGESVRTNELVARDLNMLSAGVESIRTALETAELKKLSLETELQALQARSDQLTEQYTQQNAELAASFKQQLLTGVRERYQEVLKNYGPKSASRARLRELGQQLDAIAASIDQDQDLRDWTTQLLAIDNAIMPNANQSPDDPLQAFQQQFEAYRREIEKIESRRQDLQLELIVNQQGVKLLQDRLAEKEKALLQNSMDVSASSDLQRLEAEYEEANGERLRIQQQLNGLKQLQQCDVPEFSLATPTYVAGVDSNTRKLFVLTAFFTMMILSAPIFAREYFATQSVTVEQTGRKLGLPVLSHGALVAHVVDGTALTAMASMDDLRLLALRIQQSISQPGSTVLFSGLDHDDSTFPLLCGLARCYSEREERVLIVDAGKTIVANLQQLRILFGESPPVATAGHGDEKIPPHDLLADSGEGLAEPNNGSTDGSEDRHGQPLALAGGPMGLSDFLSRDKLQLEKMILSTRFDGVDCICNGSRPFPVEGLATRRMSDVFDYARKHYDLVLVAGPPSHQLADLQLLAARADGILFTIVPGQSMTGHSQEVLQELMDLQAPIIGIVG